MFQFDAGTYDDTIAREGARVILIAGNVAAAVDFVVAMVIRSAYVAGVDNRAQAIDWINGVRVGNGQWDAWVRTVTHYYNGCAPSYSCFPTRYANYRDKTSGVYNEMGADFWNASVEYAAQYVNQTFPLASDPFELYPGQEFTGYIEMRNVGSVTWMPGATNLGTTVPRDGPSPLAGPGWISAGRPATIDRVVAPNESGRFEFTVRAPDALGDYPQFFDLVQEGAAWFGDQGGPPDDVLQVRVTVVEAPPCAGSTGDLWVCEGSDRVRCVSGEFQRETCADGCTPMAGLDAVCSAPPPPTEDLDADGYDTSLDCDDTDAAIHPDATEICDDGVDQNCDGFECHDLADGGVGETPVIPPDADTIRSGRLVGTCAASPGRSRPGSWLLLFGFALLDLRRRRNRGDRDSRTTICP